MKIEKGPNANLVYIPIKDPQGLVEYQFDFVVSTSCLSIALLFGVHIIIELILLNLKDSYRIMYH